MSKSLQQQLWEIAQSIDNIASDLSLTDKRGASSKAIQTLTASVDKLQTAAVNLRSINNEIGDIARKLSSQ